MPDPLATLWALAAGFGLGGLFYGGLWWTVRHVAHFRRPALAVLASAVLRMVAALGGIQAVAGGDWRRIVLCLVGFVLARLAVTGATRRPSHPNPAEVRRAP